MSTVFYNMELTKENDPTLTKRCGVSYSLPKSQFAFVAEFDNFLEAHAFNSLFRKIEERMAESLTENMVYRLTTDGTFMQLHILSFNTHQLMVVSFDDHCYDLPIITLHALLDLPEGANVTKVVDWVRDRGTAALFEDCPEKTRAFKEMLMKSMQGGFTHA